MSSLLSIPSTQSLPEVWVADCWLYFATLWWVQLSIIAEIICRAPSSSSTTLNWLTNTGEWWNSKLLDVRCRNYSLLATAKVKAEMLWEREAGGGGGGGGGGNRCRICDLSLGPSHSSPLWAHRYEQLLQWLQLKWPRSWKTRDSRGR